jgi:hypothetical protein
MVSPDGKLVKKPMCEVRRFSLIPIMLPVDDLLSSTTIRSTTATSLLSYPPSIELLYSSPNDDDGTYDTALTLNSLQYFDLVPPSDLNSYPQFADSLYLFLLFKRSNALEMLLEYLNYLTSGPLKALGQGCFRAVLCSRSNIKHSLFAGTEQQKRKVPMCRS